MAKSSPKKKSTKRNHGIKPPPVERPMQGSQEFWFQLVTVSFLLPTIVTSLALRWKPNRFLSRLVIFLVLDCVYGSAIRTLIHPLASFFVKHYFSNTNANHSVHMSNDPTIIWPPLNSKIPHGWNEMAKTRQRDSGEPVFFLNHVRGSMRFQQAMFRVADACGTLLTVFVESQYVFVEPLSLIGLLPISWADFGWGVLVGSSIIIGLFVVEVAMGWIHIIQYLEVVDENESLWINLLWDFLFHISVSVNEEVSLRGRVLVHFILWLHLDWGVSVAISALVAIGLQAVLFASMHARSPGASYLGLINLVVGGTAAAINVVISGGLWFPLGWHFSWNIWMGHLLGLSTSGIPMSAKLVSVVPHPQKVRWHGGRFGPEQSPLASAVYLLGLALLLWIYGTEQGIHEWNQKLSLQKLT